MNKFFFPLALASLASIAFFSSCSDEKSDPSRADLCKDGVTEECLKGGNWSLREIKDYKSCNGTLDMSEEENGKNYYNFRGYCEGDIELKGTWILEEGSPKKIKMNCTTCGVETEGTITYSAGNLEIKSNGNIGVVTIIEDTYLKNPVEVFY